MSDFAIYLLGTLSGIVITRVWCAASPYVHRITQRALALPPSDKPPRDLPPS